MIDKQVKGVIGPLDTLVVQTTDGTYYDVHVVDTIYSKPNRNGVCWRCELSEPMLTLRRPRKDD